KEAPTPVKADDPLPGPDRVLGTEPLPPLRDIGEYARILRTSTDESELRCALADVRVLGDPRAYGAVRHVAMTSLKHSKLQALQTMYWLDRERALADFLKILRGNERAIRWRSDPKNPLVERAARYAAASQMSCFLADEQATEALPLLTDVLREMYKRPAANVRGWATFRWGVLRSFCRFDDPAIKPALRTMFKSPASRWRFNGLEIAFRGAARVGDRSLLPLMRQHLPTGYTPLRASAIYALGRLDDRESMDLIRRYIDRGDEEGRAAAAEVAGWFRDRKAVPLLEKRLERDTYPWVREKIREALRQIRRED
ncbi:MAG: HEAT repeat domain-containing protein, partial [Planctomycetota bacterium]